MDSVLIYIVTEMMGHVAHVHLDIMAVSVEKHVHQTVKILPVTTQMEYATLAK